MIHPGIDIHQPEGVTPEPGHWIGLTLRQLDARVYKHPVIEDGHEVWPRADSLEDAAGVMFLCPACFAENRGPVGTHGVMCWSPRVSQDYVPRPGRWKLVGVSIDDLSLVAGSSSVLLTGGGCGAHFFVTEGRIADRKLTE